MPRSFLQPHLELILSIPQPQPFPKPTTMPSPTSLDHRASPPHSSRCKHHRSPTSRSRSRSRSPPPRRRTEDKRKISSGGFRWKDKSRDTEQYDRSDERRLERGYRERDREDRYRDWGRDDRGGYRDGDSRPRDRGGHRRDHQSYEDIRRDGRGYDSRERYDDRGSRRNEDERPTERRRRESRSPPTTSKPAQEAKPRKPKVPKIAPTEQPMIIVNVNDRLGTKTAIPCLASDSIGELAFFPLSSLSLFPFFIPPDHLLLRTFPPSLPPFAPSSSPPLTPTGDFKKLVGAHIGRKPHEIMLKRQGERPFKDILSLEDYGVSHGVQLDLEVDTGD